MRISIIQCEISSPQVHRYLCSWPNQVAIKLHHIDLYWDAIHPLASGWWLRWLVQLHFVRCTSNHPHHHYHRRRVCQSIIKQKHLCMPINSVYADHHWIGLDWLAAELWLSLDTTWNLVNFTLNSISRTLTECP